MFSWDETKNRANQAKHGIDFETAALVFDDPLALSRRERIEHGEHRWQTIGLAGGYVLLIVAHTWLANGEEHIRIISARRTTSRERKIYEQGS